MHFHCIPFIQLSLISLNIYISRPEGKKVRSKPQLARILGESFDLSAFDFRTGRTVYSACRKSKRQKGTSYDFARGELCNSSRPLMIRPFTAQCTV